MRFNFMISLMDKISNEEFVRIINESYSYKECLQKMGYASCSGSSINRLKQKILELNVNILHFKSTTPTKRNEENIFIENSTADQKVLRKWYFKGQYTPYECAICGQQPFWNGQELILILDHINGTHNDDRLENLRWVCPNCNYQLDTTNGKNKHHHALQQERVNTCIDCGAIISKTAIRCLQCNGKNNIIDINSIVGREELKNLIRTTSFVQIGKKFQVSDNAIRKWCDKYNLPRKTSDIKQYSDEEWSKI